ncbi:MAG: 5-(carboxyamino)imidazole ribonucleotide mutase [Candidatus Aminicenantes bacterium]|nr:5-(carboxyamino)imidazole ribonucleotide mutase [Candidatus Aminicenantes bacterium]
MKAKIAFILGSDSDYPFIENGIALLRRFAIPMEIEISSAHRTPERTLQLVREFEAKGIAVIIAAAGGAAHLPGVVASHTLIPVLGVPIHSALSGLDSLLSMVQMPAGVPVATFGIGAAGATNAVLFALSLLALHDPLLAEKLQAFRGEQREKVLEKNLKIKDKLAKG